MYLNLNETDGIARVLRPLGFLCGFLLIIGSITFIFGVQAPILTIAWLISNFICGLFTLIIVSALKDYMVK